jgi:hypothetical protein
MKNIIAAILLLSVFGIFSGCTKNLENSIVLKNEAAGSIYFNFRGEVITVGAGKTATINSIPLGLYSYSTTYSVPASASSSAAQGDASGAIQINAGTKFLILYSSTFVNGTYTLYATSSNSDDQTVDDTPTGP